MEVWGAEDVGSRSALVFCHKGGWEALKDFVIGILIGIEFGPETAG